MSNTYRHKKRGKLKRGLLTWEAVCPPRSKKRLGSDIHIGCDHCWSAAHWHDGNILDERRAHRRNVRLALRLGQEPPIAIYPGYQD